MATNISKTKHLRKPKKWSAHFAESNFKKAQEDLISLNTQLPYRDRFPSAILFSIFFPNRNTFYSSQQGQMRYLPWWASNEFLPRVLASLHDLPSISIFNDIASRFAKAQTWIPCVLAFCVLITHQSNFFSHFAWLMSYRAWQLSSDC